VCTLQDAGKRFSAVVDAAPTGTPQVVRRHGKPAVVVLRAETYHQMLARAARGNASPIIGWPFQPPVSKGQGSRRATTMSE